MSRLREHAPLLVTSAAIAAIEAILVVSLVPRGGAALAPHVVAPAPYGVYHDLRWLLVYHPGWVVLALGAIALVAFRSSLDLVLVRLAWPRTTPPPGWRTEIARLARFTAVQLVLLVLFVVLMFATAVTSLSWLFFVATPVLVMVAVIVHHGEVRAGWWLDAPTRVSVVATLIAFVVLSAAGAVISALPDVVVPVVAAVAGAGVAWCRLVAVHALVDTRAVATEPGAAAERARPRRPFAVVGLAAVVVIVVVGTAIGFSVAIAVDSTRTPPPRVLGSPTGSPVLVVKGFNSRWDGVTYRWVRGDHVVRRFSYRGLDDDGRPRPYSRVDTHRSLEALARQMDRQVQALQEETGERVSIVAESEGALVAQVYLAARPRAPVDALVLLSPLGQPGRVYYPPEGEDGWGVGSGLLMRAMAGIVGALGPVDVSADAPLFRSMVELGPTVGVLLACPPPGVRSYAVMPIDVGVAAPAPIDIAFDYQTIPSFHGGLLGDDTTARAIEELLAGEEPDEGSSFWAAVGDTVNALATPWQAPGLAPDLESAWSHQVHTDAPTERDCDRIRATLRARVGIDD